ncbi:MAG: 30S ribosomal protein S16 [Bdellovibrionales bacterium]|nr:30S ribosomal protein S16 [Bdellovibrionales bacterium]
MAVKIRLSRFGKKNVPYYRIAVVDERKKRDGSVIEYIGRYNPKKKAEAVLDQVRVKYWMDHGAQPTAVVSGIIKRASTVK